MDRELTPQVSARIDEILELVNKMPLDKEQRLTFAKHLISTHITTDQSEAWLPEPLALTREPSAVCQDGRNHDNH